jgi:hypothetical protein
MEMPMKSHKRQTTIFGIVFWSLFLASIGLSDRYRWLDAVWFCVGWSFAAVASVFAIIERLRNPKTSNEYGGPARSLQSNSYLPRWMMWVLLDDEQYAKYLQRRRFTKLQISRIL